MFRGRVSDTEAQKVQDLALDVAFVALQNGWPVMLADRRLTRATRYHGVRFPGDSDWWWADELSEILDKVVSRGYARVAVIGVERGNFVATWGLQVRPDFSKSSIEA